MEAEFTPDDERLWDEKLARAKAIKAAARSPFEQRAEQHLARGWAVFPLAVGSKEPAVPKAKGGHGHNDATTDPDQIARWATAHRNANVGVATGAASGVMVVDVDPRNGGDKTLAELEAKHGALPTTPTVYTGNGGLHILLQHVQGVTCGNDKLGRGVDVKAEGGYVVGVGSVIGPSDKGAGGPYTWKDGLSPDDVPVAKPPDWLVEKVQPKQLTEKASQRPASDDDASNREQLKEALEHIPSDDRDIWRRVGQALYHDLGEAGRAVWDRWSAKSSKYDAKDQSRVWSSFEGSAVTGLESIFALAKRNGADLGEIARKHKRRSAVGAGAAGGNKKNAQKRTPPVPRQDLPDSLS